MECSLLNLVTQAIFHLNAFASKHQFHNLGNVEVGLSDKFVRTSVVGRNPLMVGPEKM